MSSKEKPLDTPEHKSKRLIWIKDWYEVLTVKFINIIMLDEKWIYTINRRRKIKKLPLGSEEMGGADGDKVIYIVFSWSKGT